MNQGCPMPGWIRAFFDWLGRRAMGEHCEECHDGLMMFDAKRGNVAVYQGDPPVCKACLRMPGEPSHDYYARIATMHGNPPKLKAKKKGNP